MEKLLLGILVALMWSCREDDENFESQEQEQQNLMTMFDISPNDTAGMKIFGFADIRDMDDEVANVTGAVLGCKEGQLWVQFLQSDENGDYVKTHQKSFYGNFEDKRIVDKGYGNVDTVRVNYMDYNSYEITNPYIYILVLHDFANFSISFSATNGTNISWVVCNDTVSNGRIRYYYSILDGYVGITTNKDGNFFPEDQYVCDKKGNVLYRLNDAYSSLKNNTFINLYEYIKVDANVVKKINASILDAESNPVWSVRFDDLGETIDGHEPIIEHEISIEGEYIVITFNVTNYDGSKSTRNFRIDIETGEFVEINS